VQSGLQAVHEGRVDSVDKVQLDLMKKRGLVVLTSWKTWSVSRGPSFARVRKVLATDLTADMLKGDKWKELDFKEYNFEAAGEEVKHGALHPLMKVRAAFRQIFVEMGFEEMSTNNYVESSFWNFDTLFQPQQHPARDAHDTFFVHQPAVTLTLPEEYVAATKRMHEVGGFGSIGYRYDWKREESEKNILRTHTTACSSRMLYKLSQETAASGTFFPRRYFSIDRVFRNETLDATHLAEFYQIEGLIADRNLTLGDLIGTISTFFKRIGITDVKFKPAYNPYTEPSMEIFGFSPQLNKWCVDRYTCSKYAMMRFAVSSHFRCMCSLLSA
jgi:phenylalanyl-tRNA synthetase alpha chain